jgi:hypothetical protein
MPLKSNGKEKSLALERKEGSSMEVREDGVNLAPVVALLRVLVST